MDSRRFDRSLRLDRRRTIDSIADAYDDARGAAATIGLDYGREIDGRFQQTRLVSRASSGWHATSSIAARMNSALTFCTDFFDLRVA